MFVFLNPIFSTQPEPPSEKMSKKFTIKVQLSLFRIREEIRIHCDRLSDAQNRAFFYELISSPYIVVPGVVEFQLNDVEINNVPRDVLKVMQGILWKPKYKVNCDVSALARRSEERYNARELAFQPPPKMVLEYESSSDEDVLVQVVHPSCSDEEPMVRRRARQPSPAFDTSSDEEPMVRRRVRQPSPAFDTSSDEEPIVKRRRRPSLLDSSEEE